MREPNAFENYLVNLDYDAAVLHFVQCLMHGEQDNQAWGIMEEFNGPDWSSPPEKMKELIGHTLTKLKLQIINDIRREQ